MRKPRLVAINSDNYRARFVGKTRDKRQFFAVLCQTDDAPRQHAEFRALYLFDARGKLLEARIEPATARSGEAGEDDAALEKMVSQLGEISFERIKIRPFAVNRFGLQFGLILQNPEPTEFAQNNDFLWFSLQPGDSMAFHAPFDSGEYDT